MSDAQKSPSAHAPLTRRTGPTTPENDAWLARPTTIRGLKIVALVLLVGVVLADLVIHRHGHFGVDESFGFNAWFSFLSCVAMVLLARGVGLLLTRSDDYYDD